MLKIHALVLALVAGLVVPAHAQLVIPTEPIDFPAGSGRAIVEHMIVGKDVYGYTFEGMAGQSVTIALEAVTPSANFVLAKSGDAGGLYSSMTGERTHTQILPEDGEYVIRLLLVGQAAETGSSDMTLTVTLGDGAVGSGPAPARAETADAPQGDYADGLMGGPDYWRVDGLSSADRLNVRSGPGTDHAVIGTVRNGDILKNGDCAQPRTTIWCQVTATDGDGLIGWVSHRYLREGYPTDPEGDAMVEGTNYHAVGSIPCVIEANSAATNCEFGVTRGQPGIATVFITLPNGFVRVIAFSDGMVSPQSAVTTFNYEHSGDETSVTIDNGAESYIIPDAVIFGG
ncbi:SH3 domain-containing protein [Pelagibacterium sediminicola]|uniref:SH3 domain-containing protein n=1 Tax=Pelagibacterium sediminicola TaxID=2248761 RepID=UPI000E3162FE|nr:SH3 domain-containing protein [Pelagibacterium sediminicola]